MATAPVMATQPPLALERAQRINSAMFALALERDSIAKIRLDQITLLRETSLADMAAAGPMIKAHDEQQPANPDGSRSFSVICDDRLVAAIYAFIHFALPPAHTPDHDDYVILSLQDGPHIAFLICGQRELLPDNDDEGEPR